MPGEEKHSGLPSIRDDPEISKENQAISRLLSLLYDEFGFDFRNYAYSSLKRRVNYFSTAEGLRTIDHLRERLPADPALLQRLVRSLTIHVTAMFRDPGFYRALREQVVPIWRTYPFLRLWVAGCSTGEEVYSLAILLYEEGLYSRSRIYATDVSEPILAKARASVFSLSLMQEYTRGYQAAGGQADFSDYYTADNEAALIRPFLRENLIFAPHNLVGDGSFNEFHGIFCRNVMIYFNRALQARVHRLFYDSLVTFGYLGLGRSESMRYSGFDHLYDPVSTQDKIYRRTL